MGAEAVLLRRLEAAAHVPARLVVTVASWMAHASASRAALRRVGAEWRRSVRSVAGGEVRSGRAVPAARAAGFARSDLFFRVGTADRCGGEIPSAKVF
jgi:hypothetical protein